MDIKFANLSNIGGRKKNDDTVEIIPGKDAIRAYVGDGLGSYAGGKQASQTAGDVLITYRGSMLSDEALIKASQQAQEAVCNLQKETGGNMKTTMVFLDIEHEKARWMHIGDSRLYHFIDGKLVFQTTDHSVSQMAVMMGEITTHEIRFHEDRNRVLRSLGGENAKAELSPIKDLSEGNHAFLLCTDGFWEYVYESEMEKTLQKATDPQDWIDRMEKILLKRVTGGNDNYTAGAVFVQAGNHGAVPVWIPGRQKHTHSENAEHAPKASRKGKGLWMGLGLAAVAAVAALFLLKPMSPAENADVATEDTTAPTEQVTEAAATTEATTVPEETTEATEAATVETVMEESAGDETEAAPAQESQPEEEMIPEETEASEESTVAAESTAAPEEPEAEETSESTEATTPPEENAE